MAARILGSGRLTLPLLLPALGGLAYLWAFGAPVRLIAVNAGALVLALAWIAARPMPPSRSLRLALAGGAAGLLFLPLLTGPEAGGVSRWLPAGPVQLHSGALLLPLLTVIAARERTLGPGLMALAGAALALQPDAASLAGLAAAGAVLAWLHRGLAFGAVAAAALALAVLTFGAGTLEPQTFTENVLPDVAARSLPLAAGLGVLLFAAAPWLLVVAPPRGVAMEGAALAGLLVGLGVMAVLGPFPYPLIGYGAAPILGFGLALGALAGRGARRDPFLGAS